MRLGLFTGNVNNNLEQLLNVILANPYYAKSNILLKK